jgi:hypothetical protein
MAERRMFAKTIIDSDAFLDMPMSTQCLYFHLSMRADDDGFLNNPKKIQRMIGASDDDMNILLLKNFLIRFETGVVVIKHWKIHNYIQKDRYKPTVYQEEKALLCEKDNGVYTKCIQNVDTGKDRKEIGKSSKEIELYRDFAGDDEELYKALKEHEAMRKRIKKPIEDGGKKRLISALQKFPREQWIQILNNSTDHCWLGVFPLDEKAKAAAKPINRGFTPTEF